MSTAKLAADGLWLCLCPSWTQRISVRASRILTQPRRPVARCVSTTVRLQHQQAAVHDGQDAASISGNPQPFKLRFEHHGVSERAEGLHRRQQALHFHRSNKGDVGDFRKEPTPYLYTRLRAISIAGNVQLCRQVVEYLVRERGEKPNVQLYTALILSNVSHDQGAAWRVIDYLEEMREMGLQPDVATCHAVLKVLSVHPDHLLRTDVLDYMKMRWFQLNADGELDVAAGLLREGLFEQALDKIDGTRRDGVIVQGWLLDMAVYMLCAAGEVEEAYRIMRQRYDGGELMLSRTVWYTLLDAGSSHRHHPSASLIWNSQVNTGYINPPSGVCLNVLTTAAQAGDAVLATDVFSHLSKRGTTFQLIHYQLLIDCYLSANPPDLKRALSILTIMATEKIEPSPAETRSLYLYLCHAPNLTAEAFATLCELRDQGRKVPVAALNLIIELYVQQRNLADALKVYKLIHTFVPRAAGVQKTFANIETFNLLLRGCRIASPPNEAQASFLVSELLALRVKPTALTYDRLILVFVAASAHAIDASAVIEDAIQAQAQRARGLELLDWAFRHFADMQAVSASAQDPSDPESSGGTLGWMPRFGTVERLATQLAMVGDSRCWDVLQTGEDHGSDVEGWEYKGKWARKNVEEAWETAMAEKQGLGLLRGGGRGEDVMSQSVDAQAAVA